MKHKVVILHFVTLSLLIGCLFLVALLALSSVLNAAEPVGWEDLGLSGGQIIDIAIDPVDSNIIFAGSWYGDGLFKSTNSGATWESVEGFRNNIVFSTTVPTFLKLGIKAM